MRNRVLLLALGATLFATPAAAQDADAVVRGPGVNVSDGYVLRPSASVEAGVISNVFFEESDPVVSPVMRLLAGLEFASEGIRDGSVGAQESSQPKLSFLTSVGLEYQEFLSSNDRVRDQRGLGLNALADLTFFPEGTFAFILRDKFVRSIRPTNFESGRQLNRNVNRFTAMGRFQPGGRTIMASLRYTNLIDNFESSEANFADRIQHTIGARIDWRFLPVTVFYLDATYGFFGALGDSVVNGVDYKQSSNPLRIRVGANSAITPNTTVRAYAGFAKGFYSSGADFTGAEGGLELGWRYMPSGRVVVGYEHIFRDSINANYYGEHSIRAGVDQQVGRFVVGGGVAGRLRGYSGIPMGIGSSTSRDDFILSANLTASYVIREQLALQGQYTLASVDTDFRQGMDDPSFIRHELTLGLMASF